MSIFKPVTLSFNEKTYTIPANELMRCLAMIEDVITLQDLSNASRVPVVRLSQAYGIALRFAGANVSDEQVYQMIFENAGTELISTAVSSLLAMMIPPGSLRDKLTAASSHDSKKPKAPQRNRRA